MPKLTVKGGGSCFRECRCSPSNDSVRTRGSSFTFGTNTILAISPASRTSRCKKIRIPKTFLFFAHSYWGCNPYCHSRHPEICESQRQQFFRYFCIYRSRSCNSSAGLAYTFFSRTVRCSSVTTKVARENSVCPGAKTTSARPPEFFQTRQRKRKNSCGFVERNFGRQRRCSRPGFTG